MHTWGYQDSNALGTNQIPGYYYNPQPALAGSLNGRFAVAVSTCGLSSTVLTSNGAIHVWGYGYTGRGNINSVPLPVQLTMPITGFVPKYVSSGVYPETNAYKGVMTFTLITTVNGTHSQVVGWGSASKFYL